jgi:hypothetical protein
MDRLRPRRLEAVPDDGGETYEDMSEETIMASNGSQGNEADADGHKMCRCHFTLTN